jgi:adhesin HecA-like repeat protein
MHYLKSNLELADLRDCIPLTSSLMELSTHQHSPETTPILAIENRRENFTGSISYMSLTLSTQRLLNVSGQIVTNTGLTL